jgi:hypothetical protein
VSQRADKIQPDNYFHGPTALGPRGCGNNVENQMADFQNVDKITENFKFKEPYHQTAPCRCLAPPKVLRESQVVLG